jgi:hypothetical protein
MIRLPHLLRRLPAFAGALVLTALLSACVLSSVEPLVTDDEAVTPLPAVSILHGYNDDPAGYIPSGETPVTLRLDGKVYASDDGELKVRLIPLDEPDTYLMAAGGENGTVYGVARYADHVLDLKVVLGSNVDEAVAAAGLPGLVVEEGGIVVANRADLDAAVALIRSGKIEAGAVVYYVADGPGGTPPALLARDGAILKPKG